jgi:hypothetical protein
MQIAKFGIADEYFIHLWHDLLGEIKKFNLQDHTGKKMGLLY